jgi:prephenate dehydrogenase
MFPPKIVGIVGNLGDMAANIVTPFFERAGYKVIGSDRRNPEGSTNQQVVETADIVYFSVLPIADVAKVVRALVPYAKPDTLWLHGTSIQNPRNNQIVPVLADARLAVKNVSTGFLHFKVGPRIRSLRGQSVAYGFFPQTPSERWKDLLEGHLKEERAVLLECTAEFHDGLTSTSQVIPMLTALLDGQLWNQGEVPLSQALRMAGPPCWLQSYGALRNLSQGSIVANILVNHPHTKRIIREAIMTLLEIETACCADDVPALERMAQEGLGVLSQSEIDAIRNSTEWHVRMEGDLRGGAVCLEFSAKENRLGLLTSVLDIFDQQGLDKTSCMAQEIPGGGCTFYIGLKDIANPCVQEACGHIQNLFGGKVVAAPY